MAHVFQKRIPHFFNDRNWNRKLRFDFLQRSSKSKSRLEFSNIKDTRNLWQVFWVGSNSDPPTVYCGGGHLVSMMNPSLTSCSSGVPRYLVGDQTWLIYTLNIWSPTPGAWHILAMAEQVGSVCFRVEFQRYLPYLSF